MARCFLILASFVMHGLDLNLVSSKWIFLGCHVTILVRSPAILAFALIPINSLNSVQLNAIQPTHVNCHIERTHISRHPCFSLVHECHLIVHILTLLFQCDICPNLELVASLWKTFKFKVSFKVKLNCIKWFNRNGILLFPTIIFGPMRAGNMTWELRSYCQYWLFWKKVKLIYEYQNWAVNIKTARCLFLNTPQM